jgi:PUA domain protein
LKSNLISKSESAAVIKEISSQWKIELPKIKNLKFYYLEEGDILISGKGITAIKTDNTYLPFLSEIELLQKFPKVTVDMGAVKFMCNGANVMRPGITNFTDFKKDEIVCVVEESKNKFLAIGKSCVSSKEMETLTKGEILKNLHYISDNHR